MSTGKEMPPIPIQIPVLKQGGFASDAWVGFFRQMLYRMGGFVALTNIQLAAQATINVVGSRGAPTQVTAAGGLAYTASQQTINFIQGSGGAITVTANPQIQVGTTVGQLLKLVGNNDTNTVELQNGTGLQLEGAVILGLTTGITAGGLSRNSTIDLFWDGSVWKEHART